MEFLLFFRMRECVMRRVGLAGYLAPWPLSSAVVHDFALFFFFLLLLLFPRSLVRSLSSLDMVIASSL